MYESPPVEMAKTKYFSNFASKHMPEMRILQKGGILGKEGENPDWRNISEHCLTEAVAADILAESLQADRKKLVTAALIHDWYKRREVETMKQMGGGLGYRETAAEDERLLTEYNVPPEVISLAHANIPSSSDSKQLGKRTIEEKIMHYIDLTTSGTDFIEVETRIEQVSKKSHNIEFSESFREQYEGKSLFEVQLEVTKSEQAEFENALQLEPGTLIEYIKNKLEERINNPADES